jgi:hypothetical protein
MNTPRPVTRFLAWVRPRAEVPQPDAADMGTAFGLDMSMAEHEPLPHLAHEDDDEPR